MASASDDSNYHDYIVVAAIDFGTTFSGYAFSFKDKPDAIHMNTNWGSELAFSSYKAPTSVLTGPDDEFISFGFEAENDYSTKAKDSGYNLFRNFKMMLHNTKAGMIPNVSSKQLLIALEPEAASMFCKRLQVNHFTSGTDQEIDVTFEKGDQYIVVDAGGGTVDITVHEVITSDKVRELVPPTGGPWGGINVDSNFENFLKQIFGKDFIEQYKIQSPHDWLNLQILFEKTKPVTNPRKQVPLNINLSWSFGIAYSKYYDDNIEEKINSKNSTSGVRFHNGALSIDFKVAKSFYKGIITNITEHIENLLKNPKLKIMKYILLVGGFGQCKLLQKKILEQFSSRYVVLIPHEAQLAIIKGAVLYGHCPHSISTRIAKLTYGFACSNLFEPGIHKEEYKFDDEGIEYCTDIFSSVVLAGDEVETSSKYSQEIDVTDHAFRDRQSAFQIHSTPARDVMYITDPGVTELAALTIYHKKDTRENTGSIITFEFGGTEILVTAVSKTGGEPVVAVIDFFSD